MKSEFLVNVDHCCVLSLMSKAQKIDQKLIVGEGDHTQPSGPHLRAEVWSVAMLPTETLLLIYVISVQRRL